MSYVLCPMSYVLAIFFGAVPGASSLHQDVIIAVRDKPALRTADFSRQWHTEVQIVRAIIHLQGDAECPASQLSLTASHSIRDLGPRTAEGPRTSDLGPRTSDLGLLKDLGPRTAEGPRTVATQDAGPSGNKILTPEA